MEITPHHHQSSYNCWLEKAATAEDSVHILWKPQFGLLTPNPNKSLPIETDKNSWNKSSEPGFPSAPEWSGSCNKRVVWFIWVAGKTGQRDSEDDALLLMPAFCFFLNVGFGSPSKTGGAKNPGAAQRGRRYCGAHFLFCLSIHSQFYPLWASDVESRRQKGQSGSANDLTANTLSGVTVRLT